MLATMDAARLQAILTDTPRNARLSMADNRYRGAAFRRLEELLGPDEFRRWLAEVLGLSRGSAGNYMRLDEIWDPLVALIASGVVEGITDIDQLATQRAIKHARDDGLLPWRRGSGEAREGTADTGPVVAAEPPAPKPRGRRPSAQGAAPSAGIPSGQPPFELRELFAFLSAAIRGEPVVRPLYGGLTLGDFLLNVIPGPSRQG